MRGYGGGDREWAPQAPGGWSGRPLTRARVCGGDFRWGWGGQAQRPHHRCEVRLGDRADSTCDGRDPGVERYPALIRWTLYTVHWAKLYAMHGTVPYGLTPIGRSYK